MRVPALFIANAPKLSSVSLVLFTICKKFLKSTTILINDYSSRTKSNNLTILWSFLIGLPFVRDPTRIEAFDT
jgi:hypothetical protein